MLNKITYIILLIMLLAGCSKQPERFTLKEVVSQLYSVGVPMERSGIPFEQYELNLRQEEGYKIDNDYIFVYIFKNKEQVEEGLKRIDTQTAFFEPRYLPPIHFTYQNVLMIYMRTETRLEDTIIRAIDGLNPSKFKSTDAIKSVLTEWSDFPDSVGEEITEEVMAGISPIGTKITAKVKKTTEVRRLSEDHYRVTLLKEWNKRNDGRPVMSWWTYDVTRDGITLIESEDNDDAIHTTIQ